MKLYLHESTLSDGSLVYNVTVGEGAYLEAVTLRDARLLVDKIRAAVEAHTNSELEVVELSEAYRYGHESAKLVDGQRLLA